ncbi:hypothetical protein LOZ57_006314 [Ophidiomyces ophidiicola]|uniref:uncharacterized protein n=1 Tax=Ophidiomyces ophidiicola TaxID=1387563 RepID=UPI0020C557AA|nr:uncharacterized protein LOZ57_006314 [Ophidiomyces ophidiicola]KAI1938768.1 hypothetical protein LOZ57_006314 [Ophidiomyces ophidiicola]KAI2040502.1 hypothetical protein LOZ43_006889 [Ophidiomyces ophidiicola]
MAERSPTYSFDDPTLFLFTSLTAGSSHIITATSRLETILKVNKIGFRAIDVATDDKARMLWSTRSKGRKLPGLVRYGHIVADIEQVEEWNEYGELKDQLNTKPSTVADPSPPPAAKPPTTTTATTTLAPPSTTSSSPHIQIVSTPSRTPSAQSKPEDRLTLTLRQASEEAAAKAKETARSKSGTASPLSLQKPATPPVAEEASKEKGKEKEVVAAPESTAATTTTKADEKKAEESAEPAVAVSAAKGESGKPNGGGKHAEGETAEEAVDGK